MEEPPGNNEPPLKPEKARVGFYDASWRGYIWLFVTLITLLISTIPHLGVAAKALRIAAILPFLIAAALMFRGFRLLGKSATRERHLEEALREQPLLPYTSGQHAWIGTGYTFAGQLDTEGS